MFKNIYIFVFLIYITALSAQTPQIYINEFLASNLTTNPDMVDFGDFSDWIELYNDEDTDVNIGGFYITDDFSIPTKWQIPPNTIIPAKGFYLIWTDDFNDIPGQNYIRDWWPYNISYTTKWCHANLKMVERYSHLASAYKQKMINNLKGKFSNCHPIATSEKILKLEEKKKAS